jgi:hypothetical protein
MNDLTSRKRKLAWRQHAKRAARQRARQEEYSQRGEILRRLFKNGAGLGLFESLRGGAQPPSQIRGLIQAGGSFRYRIIYTNVRP